ncbi:MAG: hypothetical protein ACYDAM_07900 [Leptospirales bacterium]
MTKEIQYQIISFLGRFFIGMAGALAFSVQLPSIVHAKTTNILFVTDKGMKVERGDCNFSVKNILHYNQFSLDITKEKPYQDQKGRRITIPDTPAFRGVSEITYHFWHPRNESRLLDAIVIKTYDHKGHLIKHGAFDRGVFIVILSKDLFHGKRIEFQDVGKFLKGDTSLYVKVQLQETKQIALIPFATFLSDFTRRINTIPVASWAIK